MSKEEDTNNNFYLWNTDSPYKLFCSVIWNLLEIFPKVGKCVPKSLPPYLFGIIINSKKQKVKNG